VTPDVVVDIGNSRMKWGIVDSGRIADSISLSNDDPMEWFTNTLVAGIDASAMWVIASVNPPATAAFTNWLRSTGSSFRVIESHLEIPLAIRLDQPERVGLDRLLACLAAKSAAYPHADIVVVQAGTAIVINRMNAAGEFLGGAILPGLRLMAKSLHESTALLPFAPAEELMRTDEGTTPERAIQVGTYWACVGAIIMLRCAEDESGDRATILTGGDAHLFLDVLPAPVIHVPDLVLEGILLASKAMP